MAEDKIADFCIKTLANLKKIRSEFDPEVDEIIKFCDPSIKGITDTTKGTRTGKEIYDGTAQSALNLLVDGINGYLCSPNIRWFRFIMPVKYRWNNGINQRLDEIREVKLWLQECEEVRYSTLSRSNFYDMMPQFIRYGGGVGTSHMLIEEDMAGQRAVFKVPHYRECFIAEDQYGWPDTFYRLYNMSLRQMVDKFGEDRMKQMDRNFENDLKNNPYAEKAILHAIYPRRDFDRNNGIKRIASQFIYMDKKETIMDGGYDSYPVVSWRWRHNSDEIYGRSPAWSAMVDIKLANQQGRSNIKAGHIIVEPAMIGPKIMRGQLNMAPGAKNWVDGEVDKMAPKPIQTGIQLPFGVDMQDRQKKIIEDHFAVEFFLALTRAAVDKLELTATHVIEIMGEKAAVLSTRVGGFQSEGLDPIHERLFDIERRAGWIPPPPDIVMEATDSRPKIEYLGPLAQAQKFLTKTRMIRGSIQMMAELANIDQTVIDNYDLDEIARDITEATGLPTKYIRAWMDVTQIRQDRLKAQQEAAAMEAAPELAKGFRMAGIKSDEGSLADKMLKVGE